MQTSESASVIVIDATGNLILTISDPSYPSSTAGYRVNADQLRSISPYFRNLLHPNKWAEGVKFQTELDHLSKQFGSLEAIPPDELPSIRVDHVGRIGKVKDIRPLVTDFLRILHGLDMLNGHLSVPLVNLANLSIVADRFDVLSSLKAYSKTYNVFAGIQRRKSAPIHDVWNEEKCRMRILIGIFLSQHAWVQDTMQLILKGSQQWFLLQSETQADKALWWDLPMGLEDELQFRRDAAVKTLSSLLSHCLSQYTSGALQCKLGYSNSFQCDTFQLGEIVKFYNKLGLLNLETTMGGADGKDPYDGDVAKAIDLLRQVPTYQIDKFHAHCGLRNRLLPSLINLQSTFSGLAVCGECWLRDKSAIEWKSAKAPLVFAQKIPQEQSSDRRTTDGNSACRKSHAYPRDFYLANNKAWNIAR